MYFSITVSVHEKIGCPICPVSTRIKLVPKGVDYVTRMNLYNLIFQMVIPFLTHPPNAL
jgi:hypothetical protein